MEEWVNHLAPALSQQLMAPSYLQTEQQPRSCSEQGIASSCTPGLKLCGLRGGMADDGGGCGENAAGGAKLDPKPFGAQRCWLPSPLTPPVACCSGLQRMRPHVRNRV